MTKELKIGRWVRNIFQYSLRKYFNLFIFSGSCLNGKATMVDCRDEKQQKRFFPVGVETHMENDMDMNYWYFRKLHFNTTQAKLTCCSETIAQMHYISPQEMLAYEYFIYNVHPFGSVNDFPEVYPEKLKMKKILKAANVPSFRRKFVKQIHDKAHQQREETKWMREEIRKEVNERLNQTFTDSSSYDSLDKSLENV